MKISVITVNYNDAVGLRRTLESVAAQNYHNIEHIVIDGGSSDDSVNVIQEYVTKVKSEEGSGKSVIWVSEKDKGIYNAMNKGIRKATGGYIQFLNSGDWYAAPDVLEQIAGELEKHNNPKMLFGTCIDIDDEGRRYPQGKDIKYSLLQLYESSYPHETSFFKRELFEADKYGMFDESLRIVSDWKWFLEAIGVGQLKPIFVDVDVAFFDVHGISSTHKELDKKERRKVLEEVLPPAILRDYDKYAFEMMQMDRLKKHHLYGLVYFMERVLFKLEKWHILKK
jgi:glycosyltransferase involved in cell wall biosynthesis